MLESLSPLCFFLCVKGIGMESPGILYFGSQLYVVERGFFFGMGLQKYGMDWKRTGDLAIAYRLGLSLSFLLISIVGFYFTPVCISSRGPGKPETCRRRALMACLPRIPNQTLLVTLPRHFLSSFS
jgi:hypothetical protein